MTNDERMTKSEIANPQGGTLLFGFRHSDFFRSRLAGSFVIRHSLLMALFSAPVCFAQRQPERPSPPDPVQSVAEARTLVADLLAQKPAQNSTNTGLLTIRDAHGQEREIAVRFEIVSIGTNWLSAYEAIS